MIRRRPSHTPFLRQPRRARRNQAVALGWLAAQEGLGFYTHHVLPGSRAHAQMVADGELPADDRSSWADFYFLSQRPKREGIFFNATAITLVQHVCDLMEGAAFDAVAAAVSQEDANLEAARLVEAFGTPGKRKGRSFTLAPAPVLASLGHQTRYGFMASDLRARLHALPEASVSMRLDEDYAYGIGLLIVSEERSIDLHSIPRIIAQFRANGEQGFEQKVDLAPYREEIQARLTQTIEAWEHIDQRDREDQKNEG